MSDLDERAQRIVDTAIELAAADGFAAVRLRDVASTAGVALGTLYKRFASKEEILVAALEQESEKLLARLGKRMPEGSTADERVVNLFDSMTRGLTRKPNLARALIRSIASGDPHVSSKVISFHAMITGLTVATIRGEAAAEWRGEASEDQRTAAMILQHVWFASLVGWAGGQHDVQATIDEVKAAARMLMANRG
jgi:AcrR family transcriptional regulator